MRLNYLSKAEQPTIMRLLMVCVWCSPDSRDNEMVSSTQYAGTNYLVVVPFFALHSTSKTTAQTSPIPICLGLHYKCPEVWYIQGKRGCYGNCIAVGTTCVVFVGSFGLFADVTTEPTTSSRLSS
jgi:hypothetical protein